MKIGIAIEETWDFLHEIYADLCQHHEVSVFQRSKNNWPIFRDRRARALFQSDLSRFMRQNDVVFFEWASELLVAASHMPKTCGIVTRLHRYEMYQWVDRVNWDNVDQVILVTRAKQAEFIRRFPKAAGKTRVIFEAVSLDKFSFHSKPFQGDIGILCHLSPRKRVYELLLDFYELLKKTPSFHLHIGGDYPKSSNDYVEALTQTVRKLGLEERVTFYGPVTNTPDWYHKIDIFISNSYSEGLQVALLEAMASGCYCLSHAWDGVDELLPEKYLYYSGTEWIDRVLQYAAQPGPEKLAQQKYMRDLVLAQCNMDEVKRSVRAVIEQSAGRDIK